MKDIIIALMNRLSNYHRDTGSVPSEIDMFPIFHKHSSKVIQSAVKMAVEDILALQVALVNFATKVYPSHLNYIDHVLGTQVRGLGWSSGQI